MEAPRTVPGANVRRGGLIVPVPEAEPILQTWRDRLGPTTEPGVPAHVTLLYPFRPLASLTPDEQADLRAILLARPSVDVTFSVVGSFPDTVYLEPQPREWFLEGTAALSARFGLLPYGGRHAEVVPHMTVARSTDPAMLADVARQLKQALPLTTRAREVWLMEESEAGGTWEHTATFPLGT